MSDFVISQLLATLAAILDLSSFQCKKRQHIMLCLSVASLLIALHFFFLGKDAAGWMMAISAVRFYVSIYSQSRLLVSCFVLCSLGMTVFSFSGLLSLISGAANLLATLGSFCRIDKHLRLMLIAASCLWVVHNILAVTPMGALAESLYLGSAIVGYYRFYFNRKQPSPVL